MIRLSLASLAVICLARAALADTNPAVGADITNILVPVYDVSGNVRAPAHIVAGSCTLSSGTCTISLVGGAAFTDATTYFCSTSDQSSDEAAASWAQNVSASELNVFGSLSHAVNFICIGW